MIICFNCSSDTKKIFDYLIESGEYKDYAEVISVAVANLAVLQIELKQKGAVVIGTKELSISSSPNPKLKNEVENLSKKISQWHAKQKGEDQKFIDTQSNESVFIPPIFQLDGICNSPPMFAKLPIDVLEKRQEVPLDKWIFGQYNKLLPVKATCRALAHLLKIEPNGVLIEKAASKIAEEAAVLGDYLSSYDELNRIERDDALSTAFPFSGKNGEKGRLRYANHFVASANNKGQVSGLPIDFKLMNHTNEKKPCLLLTEIGWNFAILRNPILDNILEKPTQKFSDEEIDFLLNQIARFVPVEDFAYRTILSAITEGADTPTKIDTVLQKYVPHNTNRILSTSFLTSQRSGAISRMADLGLVTRIRDGVRVSYFVTEQGKQYLQKS